METISPQMFNATNFQNKAKTGPKDFFMHLLAVVMLYASAIAFSTLIFQYVNIFFPDPIQGDYAFTAAKDIGRGALATLIVVFPLFVLCSWYLNKDYSKNPEKRGLRIRKWLIYLTLFVASITIVVDLVRLVQYFLEGEMTIRFSLKVLTIAFVAGSVFGYYLADLKKHKTE